MSLPGAWGRALLVAVAAVAADQAVKALVLASLNTGESINVFYGLDITLVRNDGVAFGALGGGGPLILVLVAASVTLLLAYFARHARDRLLWLPVGAILGGAIGNLIDRLRIGKVIDFIDPIAWPAFNLADVFIVLGVAGFVLLILSEGREPSSSA